MKLNYLLLFFLSVNVYTSESLGVPIRLRLRRKQNSHGTPCHEARRVAQSNNLIGVYVPTCEEGRERNYEARQCHGSTGMCWCVSKCGKVLTAKQSAWTEIVKEIDDCDLVREKALLNDKVKEKFQLLRGNLDLMKSALSVGSSMAGTVGAMLVESEGIGTDTTGATGVEEP